MQALTPVTKNDNRLVTVGYGIAGTIWPTATPNAPADLLERIAAEPNWNAFGVIAAEVDLARRPTICR